MQPDILIFALLLLLCLFLSVREWRRYRAGSTTQFAFLAQVVCVILCVFMLLNVADENMRTKYAERAVAESIAHLRAGNMPNLDPAIHLVQKDMIAEYKGHPFPESYSVTFLGGIKDFAVADVQFSNGEKMGVHLRDVRTGPKWWPPFFAAPSFKVSLLILASEGKNEDKKPSSP